MQKRFATSTAALAKGREFPSKDPQADVFKRSVLVIILICDQALLWPAQSSHTTGTARRTRAKVTCRVRLFLRQLLIMLLTIIVYPFTCGCQQYAKRL